MEIINCILFAEAKEERKACITEYLKVNKATIIKTFEY